MSETTTAADRCRGVLIGLAAGDKIGGPSRMAVRLAESLLDCGGFNPADILERYLTWWREGAFDTGPVSERAFALLAAGMPVQEATAQVHREFGGKTAGCNPAHRSSPLAMLASIADDDLSACAMAEARLTHHDPVAGEIAVAVNRLCRSLIRDAAWDVVLRQCGACEGQEGPGNNGGFAPDVLRAALHFVATSASFAEGWSGHWRSPGLPITARFSWAQSPVPAGESRPSRKRRWPTSIFCPGSGRPPLPWLLAGPGTTDDDESDLTRERGSP